MLAHFSGFFSIACGSSTSCWAVGSYIKGPPYPAGAQIDWRLVHLVNGTIEHIYPVGRTYSFGDGYVYSNDTSVCFSATRCLIAGAQPHSRQPGAVLSLQDGKLSTSRRTPSTGGLLSLACVGESSCTAIGDSPHEVGGPRLVITWRKGSLHTSSSAPGFFTGPIGCSTANLCFAPIYGNNGNALISIKHGKVGRPTYIKTFLIEDLSCARTVCMGVGSHFGRSIGIIYRFS